ncbi:glycosyltransferase family 2 protein [Mucilaginibacter robiniae]|uniref:Glycosyltransferase family 2 protein n=1 Tax=Mucilaginibacter robiniae TaxID=2728022 RepID=A0A7L5E3C9_9SPHI|nr:glycosyltransferase family 2 protein [Mucilaginibacter robiniae]QJD97625.1 glycosyltransferase family 2 protein [Mucilaginibacter robiniae]
MKLSVIIVNHNLCKPLRHSLNELQLALQTIDSEIIVADDASDDSSAEMVKNEFPQVTLLRSDKHQGFTKTANQAMAAAQGEYLLLANPDTISNADALHKMLDFMDAHADTGGLTVRMLDAEGNHIMDAQNGMPEAWIHFFKYTGLSRLFPKTRLFSNYYQGGWVEAFESTEVDVICNTYMLLRKSVIAQIGVFDERFPVYGQDIDLSYRIRLAGFKNYYFAKTFIIWQQARQTNKYSWQHIKYFYGAMLIFATKYLFKMPELRLKGLGRGSAALYEFKI